MGKELERLVEFNRLLSRLRDGEGSSVTLLCDNPDFNGQPNNAIEVCGEWTDWKDVRFTGDTLNAAVLSAYTAMISASPSQQHIDSDFARSTNATGDLRQAATALATLQAERDAAREALRPFAEFAAFNVKPDPKDPTAGIWDGIGCERERVNKWFGPSDFRAASRALGGGE